MRASIVLFSAFVFSFILAISPLSANTTGRAVEIIHVEGLHTISEEELLNILGLKVGDALNPAIVRDGISMAFLKGVFEDISVESDNADMSQIRIRVMERTIIDKIQIEGNERISKKIIGSHFSFKEGQVIRHDLIEQAISGLKNSLAERGFPHADVNLTIESTGKPYRVKLFLILNEGQPEIIRSIRIYGPGDARELIDLSEGDIYDQIKLRNNIDKIRTHYKKNNYLSPSVGPYSFSQGELTIDINAGRKIEVMFEGNTAINAKNLLKEVPFFEAEDFRDDLVEEAVSRMTSLYHEKGFPFVQFAPVITASDDNIGVLFFIYEGNEVKVNSVRFNGISIPERNLRKIMTLRTGDLYNPDLIDSDKKTLVEFYNALGYLEAAVEDAAVKINESKADILLTIDEGARTYVAEIAISGAELISKEEVARVIKVKPGEPYNEVDVSDSRYKIIDLYGNSGFINAKVDIRQEMGNKGVKVIFNIEEGQVNYTGKTVISGNVQTKYKVIERELLYKEGSPYSYSLITKTRQRLYKLGLFTEVDVDSVEKAGHVRDIQIKLKEGNAGLVEFGLGYGDYEKYRGSFDVSYRNLFGMNRLLSFRTELSSLERRYILNYLEPWFLDKPVPLRFLLIKEDRTEKSIETRETRYKLKRYTASAGVEKKLSDKWKSEVFYEYSIVKTFDVKPDVILTKEDTGTIAISGVRPGIVYDTRDNPFDPRKGILAGVSFKIASSVLLSETDFVKVIGNISFYRELNRYFVIALAFKSGLAQGFKDTVDLPLVERFFLGGRATVRGYEQDTLGPRGVDGSPTGGNAFVLTNIELRTYVGKNFGFVTFVDGGNVWRKTSDVELSEMKYTAGIGIRYNTPVGPIRLDYGHKLKKQSGESSGELHFTIGHAF